MESSGRQLSKNTKYAIVHALLGKKVRYQPVNAFFNGLNDATLTYKATTLREQQRVSLIFNI